MSAQTIFFYNGATGGLGKYLADALGDAGATSIRIESRLEDISGLRRELSTGFEKHPRAKRAIFLQLASLVSVPLCEKEPERAKKTNVDDVSATVGAFIEETRKLGAEPEVLYVSSGHLYAPKANGRILETDELAPRSVYARTKFEAERSLTKLCEANDIRLTIARVFGLIAPTQPANYVLPGLIRRAKEKNLAGVPGLDNERDYLDSRDVCRALVRLASRDGSGIEIVNICSGEAITIRKLLELALREVHGSEGGASDEVQKLISTISAGPSRPDDITSIVGDPGKYERLIGENPKGISIEKTVREAVARFSE